MPSSPASSPRTAESLHGLRRSRASTTPRRARRRGDGGGSERPRGDTGRAPDLRFADSVSLPAFFESKDSEGIEVRTISFSHPAPSAGDLWRGAARRHRTYPSFLILAQTDEVQQEIRAAFDRIVREYEVGDRLEIPVSVKLALSVGSRRRFKSESAADGCNNSARHSWTDLLKRGDGAPSGGENALRRERKLRTRRSARSSRSDSRTTRADGHRPYAPAHLERRTIIGVTSPS